ncbi:MAG: ABC transporter permease subunit, partial [Candidatus Sericytochromatia bacterium]|nr:ABC transporter permease subunit [Candidatus Tanganyikabacteria bacterium]
GVQRLIEVWSSLPFFFIILILASIMQPNFWLLALILMLLNAWVGITYTMRGEFYRERSRDYVQAARALGVRDFKLMARHILPNALVPVVTLGPFAIVGNMSTLVGLDYLSFGLPPGTPSWGALLSQGAANIVNHPQLVYFPTLAFAGTLLCVVLVGEAVREAFDPKRYARLQ